MATEIHDRGRGPEIPGTRITVYDIVDYERMGWPAERTAAWLKLTLAQVLAAGHYINDHREEVMTDYQAMLDREKQGNPPDLRARLDEARERLADRKCATGRRKVEGGADARSSA